MTDNVPYNLELKPFRQVSRITVSLSEKVNKGNYESSDVFVSYSTDVPDGFKDDDIPILSKALMVRVREALDAQLANIAIGGIKAPIDNLKSKPSSGFSKRFGGTK